MNIKRVEIVGFKSFVDKVSLDFPGGVVGVVGPNGCGKSNIVDAIRWVMGEQSAKNLRGRFMEDVIFGGSESRKPMGMAEVSLVFSNSSGLASPKYREYAEIMVTRRLYRNGESDYLINKTPCRLLDITELFMDTGVGARAYSIIEQGKIGMILNSKPEERRFLIEEAAGVTKYKSRKKTALRKIDGTRQNLLRLGDIIAEVRRQLGSLKRQAQKAERYRSCREELKGIETRFARERYHELQEETTLVASEEQGRQRALEGLAGRLQEGELLLEELRLQQVSREKEVSGAQERVFHLSGEIQKVEGRIEFSGKELGNLDRLRERLAAEEEEILRRFGALDREEEALRAGKDSLGKDLEDEIRRLADGEAVLEELAGREQEVSGALEVARQELYTILTGLSRLGSLQEEAQRRLLQQEERVTRNRSEAVSLREQMVEAQKLVAALESTLEGFRERRTSLQEEKLALGESLRSLRTQVEGNENALLTHREELNRQGSRLESLRQMEKSLEGYAGGVKTLLAEAAFQHCFDRLVADLIEVPPRYEAALEAFLGDRLQALPAQGPSDVRAALDFLAAKGGRCTFLLPGFDPAPPPTPAGAVPLSTLLQARSGAEDALQALLAGGFLVESLEPFVAGGIPLGTVLVTEAGEVLTARGELTGGGREALDQGLLHKRREIKDLAESVERAAAEVDRLQVLRLELRETLAATEEGLREVEAALHRKEIKVVDSEKDLHRLKGEKARLEERLEVLSLEEDQLHEERLELERQQADAASGRKEKETLKGEFEATVARLQEELQVLRRQTEVAREGVTSMKVAVASLREREEGSRRSLERLSIQREELRGRLAVLKGQTEEGTEEKERLRAEVERLRVELELLYRRREEEKSALDRLREHFEEGGQRIEEQETLLKGVRTETAVAREAQAGLQMRGRELALEADHLRQAILDRYRLDLSEPLPEEQGSFDPQTAERRLEELRRTIEEMGEVNLTAIEEYQRLEERYGFLTTQQQDLQKSMEDLQKAIAKINRTTRKRFRETFDLVNEKFQEVFPRLFRGGKAELTLTDEEDLLETGIEIVVQPPGKKLQNVTLLSGGEKALTAVALIFSIFLIKPSPFCMLDEVDAPLDDANIGRFNEMIREMSEHSQFIIVTHSKKTMEIADTLYGVTMEEPGVSKIVSVRMNEFHA